MARPMMLLAYDAAGQVVATLDYMVALDENGDPRGLVDFAAIEAAGGELTDVWRVDGAAGSGTWPEWLGSRASEFRVERAGGRIVALEHVGRNAPPGAGAPVPASGHRRRREDVEAAIAERIAAAAGAPADIRDLVGGPERPLGMDPEGRTTGRGQRVQPTALPVIERDTRTGPTRPAGLPGADSPPPARTPR